MNPTSSALLNGANYHVQEEADFVIVGSGATGATAARWLAAAGKSVVIVEEGGLAEPAKGAGFDALKNLYRDGGAAWTEGADRMTLLQGRVLGGSSFVSGSVHVPLPQETWNAWAAQDPVWKARIPWPELEAAHERMDRELAVQKTPRTLLREDAEDLLRALPAEAMPTWRGAPGCVGAGRCHQGCPHAAKSGANLTLLPLAMQKQTRIHTQCRIDRVEFQGRRATGVRGKFPGGWRFHAHAREAVIVAAGAIETPALLLRSGLDNVGQNWSCHPGLTVSAQWNRPLDPHGATRSVDLKGEGFDIETQRMPDAWRRLTLPGLGQSLTERANLLEEIATWSVRMTPRARGRVRLQPLTNRPIVQFSLLPEDRALLGRAIAKTLEAMLLSGALQVFPNVQGWPEAVTSLRQAADLAKLPIPPGATPLFTTQIFGGVPTDTRGQVIGTERLIALDASTLPGPPGVPPLSLLHAMATVVAQKWV